jgi:hypothetical protein
MTKQQLLNGGRTLGLLVAAIASLQHSNATDAHAGCVTCEWVLGSNGQYYSYCVVGGAYTYCYTFGAGECYVGGSSSACQGW